MKLQFGNSLTPVEIFEALLTLLCVAIAFARPGLAAGSFARIEGAIRWLSERPAAAMAVLALLPILLRAILLPVYGTPSPVFLDEHSYLLQGDTFAHGRLANPPHPLWEHFETLYVLSQPSYASQYQPGQGAVLALGEVFTGNPWTGVALSMGIMCALIYWAMRAWLPAPSAFVGGLIGVLQFGVLSYWMNSYFGGCVPASGGLLAVGALARLRESHRALHAALAALGIVIILNSRPLEGLILLAGASAWILYWVFVSKEFPLPVFARNIVLPCAVVFGAAGGFAAYFNSRVTGDPTVFPYALNRKLYGTPQTFFFQKPIIIDSFRYADIRDEYETQLALHERRHSPKELVVAEIGRLRTFWSLYIGPALTVPLLFLPFIWRERNMGFVLFASALFALNIIVFFAFLPHYAAPALGLIFIVLLVAMRKMRATGPRGLFLSRALPFVLVAGLLAPMAGRYLQAQATNSFLDSEFAHEMARETFLKQLLAEPGDHIVLVRYQHPGHFVDNQWVYNEADIDHSRVVWARELDPAANARLLEYFKGRKVWLGEPDAHPPRITPYTLR